MKPLLPAVLALASLAPCWSAPETDPACIVAPGFAAADVSPDVVTLDFALEMAADSFQEGAAKARAVRADLESLSPPADGVVLAVHHDQTFMQQKKWTPGTRQRFQFRLRAIGVPDARAQEVMVVLAQAALTKLPSLTVTGIEAQLSDARVKRVQQELLRSAIADAGDFAGVAAGAAQLPERSVRSVRVGGPAGSSRPYELQETDWLGFSRSFKLEDTLASTIRVSVSVVVEYGCASR